MFCENGNGRTWRDKKEIAPAIWIAVSMSVWASFESLCISTTQIQKCFAHLNNGKMKMATPASNICYIIRQKENSNINCAVRILPTKRFYCVAKFGDSILCDNGWFAATTLFISLALSLFLPFYQVLSVMLSLSRLMFNPLYVVPILYVSKIVLLSFYMLWIQFSKMVRKQRRWLDTGIKHSQLSFECNKTHNLLSLKHEERIKRNRNEKKNQRFPCIFARKTVFVFRL